jgi:hypothetical protein
MEEAKQMMTELAQIIVSNDQFARLLRDVVGEEKRFTEHEPTKAVLPKVLVFSKHGVKEKFDMIPMILMDFPPPPDAPFDRFEALQFVGKKYCEEMVKKQDSGKKNFPLAIFIISEAWLRGFVDWDEKDKPVAEYPDKQEVVIATGMTMDGRQNSGMMRVKRNKQSHIFLSEPKYVDYGDKIDTGSDLTRAFYVGFVKALNEEDLQP